MEFKSFSWLIVITISLTMFSCKHKTEYFIYSQHQLLDSLKQVEYNNKINIDLELPPPPPMHHKFEIPHNFYSNLVIILDSNNQVYLYQTENKYIKHKSEFIVDTKCFNFIDLKPEHLLTFSSENLIQFLKQNDDIFGFDSINKDNNITRLITLATTQDTIKNAAFYSMSKYLKMYMCDYQLSNSMIEVNNVKSLNYNFAILRKTTEEENVVLFHKKNKLKYNPQSLPWSNHFINGKCKPFTSQYDSLENRLKLKSKAIPTFKSISKELLIYK